MKAGSSWKLGMHKKSLSLEKYMSSYFSRRWNEDITVRAISKY